MADFSDTADEFAGRARQAAGNLTGDHDSESHGVVDVADSTVK